MSAHRATKTRIPSRASLCEATLEIIGQGLRARYELPQEVRPELRRLLASLNLRHRRSRKSGRSDAILLANDEARRIAATIVFADDEARRIAATIVFADDEARRIAADLSSSGCEQKIAPTWVFRRG
jgi:hypothetical protein